MTNKNFSCIKIFPSYAFSGDVTLAFSFPEASLNLGFLAGNTSSIRMSIYLGFLCGSAFLSPFSISLAWPMGEKNKVLRWLQLKKIKEKNCK